MSLPATIAGAEWLKRPALKTLMSALTADGEEARFAGGAVRNTLLGEPVTDVDIATTNLPDDTMARAAGAGFRAIPTGHDHGTITVVADGEPYEVTTLRDDVETFGRHATVAFGRDWKRDAERRDFTINALYAEADGTIVDLVGGLADLEKRNLRFIGEAEQRIREDYLRILRFFRFFAWYGHGRPDADGLKACARLKSGLAKLSAERVWAETKRLLSAPDPSRALLWMRQTGVLTAIVPETEKWGIDSIPGLIEAERSLGWAPDAMLRLEAMLPPDAVRLSGLAERLKLSKAEAARLNDWALAGAVPPDIATGRFELRLYNGAPEGIRDRLRLALASARARAVDDDTALRNAGAFSRLLKHLENWKKPDFPLRGADLEALGQKPGKAMGETLRRLEAEWVAGGFAANRDALMARAAEMVAEAGN